MGALMAAPGIHQPDLRESSRAQSQARGIAVAHVPEVQVASFKRNFAFVHGEADSQRPIDGMFKAGSQKQKIRRAEAVVLVTCERLNAVDIRSAKRRLKKERDDVSGRHD